MEYSLFADESGISPVEQCFTIGCLLVPQNHLQEFEDSITQLIENLIQYFAYSYRANLKSGH